MEIGHACVAIFSAALVISYNPQLQLVGSETENNPDSQAERLTISLFQYRIPSSVSVVGLPLITGSVMGKISTLVVAKYWVIRDGLCEILGKQEDIECAGTANNIQEAVELTKHLMPNVVIIDVARHDQYPVEATKLIKSAHPSAAVLIISRDKDIDHVRACMQAGVSGYLLRDGGFEELIQTIRMLKFGKTVFGIGDVSRVLYGVSSDDPEAGKRQLTELHAREVEVITLVGKGMSNKEISAQLGISESTVGSHLVNVFRKLDARSRTEAVMYALREGWINVEDLGKQV